MNRVVTGYDEDGRAAIISRGEPHVVIHAGRYTTTELWVSDQGPVPAVSGDTSTREWALEPPPGGARFRIVEIAPAEAAGRGGAEHEEFQGQHSTDTLDYVTILRGQVTLVVGDATVILGPGDSVVQQPGVPHDWRNDAAEPAVMVGVLLSAR